MRKLPVGVAVSAAVHVALIAMFSAAELGHAPERSPPAPRVDVIDVVTPPAEEPPLEVAVLPPDEIARVPALVPPETTPPPAAAPLARDRGEPARGDLAIVTPRTTGELPGTTAPPATTEPPGRTSMFDMRRGKIDLGVGRATDYRDALDHVAPPGTGAKPEVPESGQLQPAGGGTYRSDQGVFTAKIAEDGSVSLKDSKNFRYTVPLAHPGRFVRGAGRAVADWYQDADKPVGLIGRPSGPGDAETRVNLNEAIEGKTDLSEARGRGNEIDTSKAPIPIMGGGFDVTDALMRRNGVDPYAAKKLAFLDATRAERVEMGKRHRAQQAANASRIMKANLDRLAGAVSDPAARKRALFELWDEIVETGSDEVVAAGRSSRLLVIGFIRTHHAAGSPTAYTPEELAALNATKQSAARFAPYE